jgi:hypothetical protein
MADDKPAGRPSLRTSLAGGLMVTGIGLLLISFFWSGRAASRASWSAEQAKQYQAASVKLHSLSQESVAAAGSNNEKALREKLAQAETEYKAIRSQLDSAIDRPKYITYALRILGSLMAIAGVMLIYRRAND